MFLKILLPNLSHKKLNQNGLDFKWKYNIEKYIRFTLSIVNDVSVFWMTFTTKLCHYGPAQYLLSRFSFSVKTFMQTQLTAFGIQPCHSFPCLTSLDWMLVPVGWVGIQNFPSRKTVIDLLHNPAGSMSGCTCCMKGLAIR